MFKTIKFWIPVFLAWVLFIGVDFFFHAGITSWLWSPEIIAFKSEQDLFRLIPAGYASFFFLVVLIGFAFNLYQKSTLAVISPVQFGLIFGFLFSISYFLGLLSYVEIPPLHLAIISGIYFIEIIAVVIVLSSGLKISFKKLAKRVLMAFLLLVVLGILIQNITQNFE